VLTQPKQAEAGMNGNVISGILVWANSKMASHYTKAENRERMARQGIKANS
jgi:hypothetical protein